VQRGQREVRVRAVAAHTHAVERVRPAAQFVAVHQRLLHQPIGVRLNFFGVLLRVGSRECLRGEAHAVRPLALQLREERQRLLEHLVIWRHASVEQREHHERRDAALQPGNFALRAFPRAVFADAVLEELHHLRAGRVHLRAQRLFRGRVDLRYRGRDRE